jgi:FAD/FMN-containing dehydrogenase
VPQGGNTGWWGGVPDASGTQVLLSLQRLNRVRAIDSRQPGHHRRSRRRAAGGAGGGTRQARLMFPLSLAAEGSCTIGGNLATNAGGTQVLRYGNTRDLCLGWKS